MIKVLKRDGRSEVLDLEKIHRVTAWAADGLDNVSPSTVELRARLQFFEGMATKDIHASLIKTAADLISEETPGYQYMAARLNMFQLRKEAFGKYNPPSLFEHISKMVKESWYDGEVLELYSKEEIDYLDSVIVHDRDMTFSYAAVKQLAGKYLVQDRVTKDVKESPQFLYMLVAMCLFSRYDKEIRLDYVKRFYDSVSTFKISLPTPIMGGVRTKTRQYSSCVLIESDDSLDSINASSNAIVKYISQRAGIGIYGGSIRALGSPIRGGEAVHTGVIPFWKMFQAAVKSCSQG